MYDIKQFRPTLYFLVLMGLTGFSMAAESPLLWLFSAGAVCLNAYLVRTGRFTPLPRWLANLSTVLALLYVAQQIATAGRPPLMFIGQFLVLLQIIKLFEQRANRDYAQLIVLSLLLMVAASINTASLLFGVLMAFYLVVSLYCCLIFHLKVEADKAKAAFAIPEDRVSPATLRQDQRFLPRSMRRLTALVSVFSVSLATLVFLFFPRGAGAGVLGQLQFTKPTALTGFSDRVSFEEINRIKQNEEVVAHVSVWVDDQLLQGTQTLLLRGLTLDVYGGDANRSASKPQWTRGGRVIREERDVSDDAPYETGLQANGPIWKQKVLLRPTGTRFLFALAGPMSLKTNRHLSVRYAPSDESIQTDQINLPLDYEVTSLNGPTRPDLGSRLMNQLLMPPPGSDPRVLQQVREYTLRPEVIGGAAAQRSTLNRPLPGDEELARKIEQHLQQTFAYTLDLTDSRDQFRNVDPVVAFLTTVKKGHCEYFASAMTLMCQSLGMQARMVIGFKCDEYNVYGGHYIVKQSHAHAWVEVLTPRGWVPFDPTSGREATVQRTRGIMGSIRHFFDYLEFKWAEHVVAYENRDRQQLIDRMDGWMTNVTYGIANILNALKMKRQDAPSILAESSFWDKFRTGLYILVAVMILMAITAIVVFFVQQRRLRRRAARIGLDHLPVDQQMRLARQLAFYDRLTRSLARHRITRPAFQTPMEFADSLVFLPQQAYDTVIRLTRLFYRVRFGQTSLEPDKQRRLERVVSRLAEALDRLRPRALSQKLTRNAP